MTRSNKLFWLAIAAVLTSGCAQQGDDAGPATAAEADAFVERMEAEGLELYLEGAKAAWLQSTHITTDSMWLSAKINERAILANNANIEESRRFSDLELTGNTGRTIQLLQLGSNMPSPSDPALVAELSTLSSELEGMYGAESGLLNRMSNIVEDPDSSAAEKLEAWLAWRAVSVPMRDKYARFVELMNMGAVELGYGSTAELWQSKYDMDAAAFEAEAARLWGQVQPLYEQLHCYVRDQLADHYGDDVVSRSGPIPAHLLGNMWAQDWANLYDMVKPYDSEMNLDVTGELERRRDAYEAEIIGELGGASRVTPEQVVEASVEANRMIAEEMVRFAESFYTSMGLMPLPDSFYELSMFTQPRDRDVVCHASAWPMDGAEDVRIKMCIEPNEEDLRTIYHELGHIYYYLYYQDQPLSLQSGAHDGFHEAIGDSIVLAMTPEYLQSAGLISNYQPDEQALINSQMKQALEGIAFLPFGKMIDEWRWRVFSGEFGPDAMNAGWWQLREQYQGVTAPVARSETDFDPGAKYHIPGNTPYTRYFLARILQYQFLRSMCDASGYEGDLYACSFYGSEAAGENLAAMLAMGQSRPWPEALAAMTGSPDMDASAIIDYFQPLMGWLEERNSAATCGW